VSHSKRATKGAIIVKVSELLSNATKLIKSNSPEILTALGIGGVVTTSYLVGKAAFKAAKMIEEDAGLATNGKFLENILPPKERLKREIKLTWKEYIPAGVSGAATIACIVCVNRTSGRRTAAAVAAYSLTERAFSEYKDKVVEQVGINKEEKVRAAIAQDKVTNNPLGNANITILAGGNSLCFDLTSMRYFRSDYETLRRFENEINFQLVHERYMSLSDFYALVGLDATPDSVHKGWSNDRLMELDINTTLADNNEPCLTIDFNYLSPLP
jgi:hypothetical protein